MDTRTITVELPEELGSALEKVAALYDTTVPLVIEQAVVQYLLNHQQRQAPA